jgi:hypothetical protein
MPRFMNAGSPLLDGLVPGMERALRAAAARPSQIADQDPSDDGLSFPESELADRPEIMSVVPPHAVVPIPQMVGPLLLMPPVAINIPLRRRRRVIRDSIQGISKNDIRRLARRGGVKRVSGLCYEEVCVPRIFAAFHIVRAALVH